MKSSTLNDSEDEIVCESDDAFKPGRFGLNEQEEAEVMTGKMATTKKIKACRKA